MTVATESGKAIGGTLWKVINHKKVARNVDTGTARVTRANADRFGG